VHRFGQGGQGLDPALGCAGKRSAAQPWRWHNANNMCTTRDLNRVTASGECTRQRSVLTRLLAQEGRAFARRWRAQCVGADGEPELGVRSSGQRYDTIARQGSARGDDGSDTCKATGSARWPALKRRRVCAAARCGTAVITQTASSQGSVQPRLKGRVHNKVKGVEAHLALLDTAAKKW
jgi:hypothetical protein